MILVRYGIATVLLISTMFALQDTVKVERKDSKKAFVYSLFPGMGQAYNGKWIKSALIIGLEVSSFMAWRLNLDRYNNYDSNNFPLRKYRYLEKRNKYAWWMGIIYVYSMIDAVVDSHLHSFDHLMNKPIEIIKNSEEKNEK